MIKRVKVHSEDALKDPNYRFPGNYGVEKYLELFSGKELSSCFNDTYNVSESIYNEMAKIPNAELNVSMLAS